MIQVLAVFTLQRSIELDSYDLCTLCIIYAYVHVYIHIFSFAENLPLSRFFNPSPSNAFFYSILKYKCSEDMILPLRLFSIETGAMNAY